MTSFHRLHLCFDSSVGSPCNTLPYNKLLTLIRNEGLGVKVIRETRLVTKKHFDKNKLDGNERWLEVDDGQLKENGEKNMLQSTFEKKPQLGLLCLKDS